MAMDIDSAVIQAAGGGLQVVPQKQGTRSKRGHPANPREKLPPWQTGAAKRMVVRREYLLGVSGHHSHPVDCFGRLRNYLSSSDDHDASSFTLYPLPPAFIIRAARFKMRATASAGATPRLWMLEIKFRSASVCWLPGR